MPKITGTKKLRAAELLDRAIQGPALDLTFSSARLTAEQKKILEAELQATYRRWSRSWLLPELKRLVPELRQLSDQGKEMPTTPEPTSQDEPAVDLPPGNYHIKYDGKWMIGELFDGDSRFNTTRGVFHKSILDKIGDRIPSPNEPWKVVPTTHTLDMAIGFAEVWYTKLRAIDDDDMQDAYTGLLEAAPKP